MQPAYTATPVTRGLYRDQLLALADCARTDLRNRHGIGLLILLPKNLPKRANLDVVWEVLTSQLSAYQFEWGGKGGAPGQLSLPHSIVLDGAGRVYVANRGNARIQIFTGGGTFISQIKTPGWIPFSLALSKDGRLFVTDGGDKPKPPKPPYGARVVVIYLEGNILDVIGRYGTQDGQYIPVHLAPRHRGRNRGRSRRLRVRRRCRWRPHSEI